MPIFKSRKKFTPKEPIQKMFKDKEEGKNNLGRKDDLQQPFARTTQKSMCISVCGVTLWNELPEEIRQSNNITQFKHKYKKNIFNKYSNEEN